MEKRFTDETKHTVSYHGNATTVTHLESGDSNTANAPGNNRGQNFVIAFLMIDLGIRTRYGEHLETRITQLQAQLQAAEDQRDRVMREAADTVKLEHGLAFEVGQLKAERDQLEAQLPRWNKVLEGWPEVEGLYLVQIGEGPYAFTQSWHDPESKLYWQGQDITRYILVSDLEGLPGGPGEATTKAEPNSSSLTVGEGE